MRCVVSGRLREPCALSPREYFTLAIREWEVVLGWLAGGRALAYGRLRASEGAILLEVESEAEARNLANRLPFRPIHRSGGSGGRIARRSSEGGTALLLTEP